MRYVFGPVPSRRLGRSLGVDTVPLKTCNWNCIYCQLGRSTPVVNERTEYVPVEAIAAEVRGALDSLGPDAVDWITFVASGEGTLHSRIGQLVREVKGLSDLPIAVITNGSTLSDPEVRAGLAQADVVMPTLDAGTAALYRRINRPHPDLTFERHVGGIEAFARMEDRRAKLWIEVVLIGGVNDTEEALGDLAELLERLDPEEIHITLPTRCTAEAGVAPPNDEGLMRAMAMLGPKATLANSPAVAVDLSRCGSMEDAIASVVSRHPMRRSEVEKLFGAGAEDRVNAALEALVEAGHVQITERFGEAFVAPGGQRYGRKR